MRLIFPFYPDVGDDQVMLGNRFDEFMVVDQLLFAEDEN